MFEFLLFIYCGGCTGSLIGAALFTLPSTSADFLAVISRALLWPLSIYHVYNDEINKRALVINTDQLRVIHKQHLLIKTMSENAVRQNQSYFELKEAYDELVRKQNEKPETQQLNGKQMSLTKGNSP